MKTILFVPARSGSLGVKNKNLAMVNGKPLLYYTLKICQKLRKQYDVFISTDSNKIVNYCSKFGFNTNYRRPKILSSSTANIIDGVFHGINWYEKKNNQKVSHVVLLQPTSPLRKIKDVRGLINLVKKKKIESISTVSKVRENYLGHIELTSRNLKNKNSWKYISQKASKIIRRQEYNDRNYIFNGSIYMSSLKFLNKYKKFSVENKTKLFFTEKISSIEIDYLEDMKLANAILKSKTIKIH